MDHGHIHLLSASDGRYKMIRDRHGRSQLFDLERDPGEEVDVSDDFPDINDRLAASLDAYLAKDSDEPSEYGAPRPDDSLSRQLRALGYIQ